MTRIERTARLGTIFAIAIGAALLGPASADAAPICGAGGIATKTWDGGAGTAQWQDAANWAPNGVPGSTAHVCIPNAAPAAGVEHAAANLPTTIRSIEATRALRMTGGRLSLTDTAQPSSLSALRLVAATHPNPGTIVEGDGALSIGTFVWTGGELASATGAAATVTGSLTVSGDTGSKVLRDRTLVLATGATASLTGSGPAGSRFLMSTDSRIEVRAGATLDFTGDRDLEAVSAGSATIVNDGTIRKSAGSGESIIDAAVRNNATTSVQTGTLRFQGGIDADANGGTFQLANGMTLDIASGSNDLTSSTITDGIGAGTLRVSGGTTTLAEAGSLDVASVTLQGGTFDPQGPNSIPTLTLGGGTLEGGGLTVGNFSWSAGTHSKTAGAGTVSTTVTGSLGLSNAFGAPAPTLSRTLALSSGVTGSFAGSNVANFELSDGRLVIQPGARFDFAGDGDIVQGFGGAAVVNDGAIRKLAGTGESRIDGTFANNGALQAQTGTVHLSDTSSDDPDGAAIQLSNGTTLRLSQEDLDGSELGDHHLGDSTITDGAGQATVVAQDNATLDGPGLDVATLSVSGDDPDDPNEQFDLFDRVTVTGTLSVPTVNVSAAVSAGVILAVSGTASTMNLSRGTLRGSGGLSIGAFNWTGGEHSGSAVPTTVTGSLSVAGSAAKTLERDLVLAAGASGSYNGSGFALDHAELEIQAGGALTVAAGADIGGNDATIVNDGTIRTTPGSGDSVIGPVLTNDGAVEVGAGSTLAATGGLTNHSAGTLSGGAYDLAGAFRFADANIVSTSAEIVLDGPAAEITDTSAAPRDALGGLASNAASGKLTLAGGKDLAIPGPLTNAGTLTVGASSVLGVGVATPATLTNTGTVQGTGTIVGNVANGGTVAPGASPGVLTVDGGYTQQSAGTLEIEIDGAGPGVFDRLAVGEAASLDGTLALDPAPGFEPTSLDEFQILTHASRTGQFATVEGADQGDITYVLGYTATDTALTVDDEAPPTTTITGPATTNDNTPTYNLSAEPGSTFECRLDGDAYSDCSGASSHTTAPLVDGDHTLRVRATDAASNVESPPASKAFTIDTRAPETEIDSGPRDGALLQRGSSHQVAFSASEPGAAFRCSVNDGPLVACTSPQILSTSTEGQFSLEVRATDAAGNADSSSARLRYTVVSASCAGQEATIIGTEGPDHITGTSGNDVIVTFGGDDEIAAGEGEDRVCSGPGDDLIEDSGDDQGASGLGDYLAGGSGDDVITGSNSGADTFDGGSGDDTITVTGGDGLANVDELFGGSGADRITGGVTSDLIKGGDGDDELRGGAGHDGLFGGGHDDALFGDAQNDTLRGGSGDDSLDGGSGSDTCSQGSGSGAAPVSC